MVKKITDLTEFFPTKYWNKENAILLASLLAFMALRPNFQKEHTLILFAVICVLLYIYCDEVSNLPLVKYTPLVGTFFSGFGTLVNLTAKPN